MILADKIIRMRKRNGWSQEELAQKMGVSRQAVSKWEGAQTIPDLDKILLLGELFGVTTDYLLKDELEVEAFTGGITSPLVRRITLDEANAYLAWRKTASVQIAFATFLCILSLLPLLLLGGAAELTASGISDTFAGAVGLAALFLIVAGAVAIYLSCGFRSAPYEFLEKEPFEPEYGVTGMVREAQRAYRSTYIRYNILATCLCVLSPVPLLVGAFTKNDFFLVGMLTLTMLIAGIGVMLFIVAGVRWASMQKLLQEGDYAPRRKEKNKLAETVSLVYWLTATAIYLGWSFATEKWASTWIVWPIAGVLYVGVMAVCYLLADRPDQAE